MDKETFNRLLEKAKKSTLIKSTRRILFNHLNQSIEERGAFHVDHMYGAGTGILLKIDSAFFLLTANHVIQNATKYEFKNESPFWICSKADQMPTDLWDYMMPGRILHVGELLCNDIQGIDATDIVLVELFYPMTPVHMPDLYIDLDANPQVLVCSQDIHEGWLLLAAGFPFDTNSFSYEGAPEGFTHTTTVNRCIVDGFCVRDENSWVMSLEPVGGKYPNLSGASGGVVTNVPPDGFEDRMMGMMVSAGTDTIRFVPSHIIKTAVSLRNDARVTVVDPQFKGQPDREFFKLHEAFSHLFGRNGLDEAS